MSGTHTSEKTEILVGPEIREKMSGSGPPTLAGKRRRDSPRRKLTFKPHQDFWSKWGPERKEEISTQSKAVVDDRQSDFEDDESVQVWFLRVFENFLKFF